MIKEIQLGRYSGNKESTLGLFYIDWAFFCHCLEDEFREIKIKGETRIPDGVFELGLRKEISPKTESYRSRYSWFKWHIQILNVPGFDYVYIHIGNDDDDTDGCLLLSDGANNNTIGTGYIPHSAPAFKRFYQKIYPLLEAGHKIQIRISDIEDLFIPSHQSDFIGPPSP